MRTAAPRAVATVANAVGDKLVTAYDKGRLELDMLDRRTFQITNHCVIGVEPSIRTRPPEPLEKGSTTATRLRPVIGSRQDELMMPARPAPQAAMTTVGLSPAFVHCPHFP
jgi:hypothetical protein